MGRTADKITRIIGIGQVRNLLDGLDAPEEPVANSAKQWLADMDPIARQGIALIELGHTLDELVKEQRAANGGLKDLQAAHNRVMSGEGPSCRHMERMKTAFWKAFAMALAAPITVGVIVAAIIFVLTRKG